MNRHPRLVLAIASLPLILSISACSSADEDGDTSTFEDDGNIPAETVQGDLEAFLEENEIVGTVESCGEIEDKVDATTTCAATIDDIQDEVTVTVDSSTDTETVFAYDLTAFGYEYE